MAKVNPSSTAGAAVNAPKVVVKYCDLFKETATNHLKPGSTTAKSFEDFIATKVANPNALYGTSNSDKANPSSSPMSREVPKIRHAHLRGSGNDVSIFYTIGGANPSLLKLYAILTHDEAGTGQPTKEKVQKSMGRRMANQTFY